MVPFDPVRPDVDLVALAELCSALAPDDLLEPSNPRLIVICREGEEIQFNVHGEVTHVELRDVVVPPPNAIAIALLCGGWMAQSDDQTSSQPLDMRPSRHPDRRRVHSTTVIGGAFSMVTVLRVLEHPDPMILTGCTVGRVPDALEACWLRGFLEAA